MPAAEKSAQRRPTTSRPGAMGVRNREGRRGSLVTIMVRCAVGRETKCKDYLTTAREPKLCKIGTEDGGSDAVVDLHLRRCSGSRRAAPGRARAQREAQRAVHEAAKEEGEEKFH